MNTPSRQLVLDIRPVPQPSFDNYIAGANAELVARLRAIARPDGFDAIYVWGQPGSGRSHLLRATEQATHGKRPACFVDAAAAGADLAIKAGGLLIVDNVERLGGDAQVALFRAFNTAGLVGLALLMSGSAPPRDLALREDLRTRIGSALIYEVQPLSDAEKAETLRRHAEARGLRLDPDVVQYLLRHARRDLPSLMAILDELDRLSLEQKRAITLPLLRDVLTHFKTAE